nr:helix-turn-helix domain-containing protein [Intrasporangium flavum]
MADQELQHEEDAPAVGVEPRLYSMPEVAALLSTSVAQVRALVRSGEMPAMRLGGRGQWRVERSRLEAWIDEQHEATARWVKDNPFPG